MAIFTRVRHIVVHVGSATPIVAMITSVIPTTVTVGSVTPIMVTDATVIGIMMIATSVIYIMKMFTSVIPITVIVGSVTPIVTMLTSAIPIRVIVGSVTRTLMTDSVARILTMFNVTCSLWPRSTEHLLCVRALRLLSTPAVSTECPLSPTGTDYTLWR